MTCERVAALLFIISTPIVTGLEPDFLYPLENVTVPQGRDASFTCVVNNLGGYRVAWIKADSKAILAIHEHVITDNSRLSVTHNDFNTWVLNIKETGPEDRGLYMCQINTDPMKSQSAYLEVVIPPDIIYDETTGDLMVPEGSSAKLVCKARGYPQPEIIWRREDRGDIIARVISGGSKTKLANYMGDTLTLTKVTRSEMGIYMCIASNGVPPSVSKQIMLHVHFHPMIRVPNQLVGAPMGTNVTLICHVEASPKAINYWTRETGDMIINNHQYSMTEEKTSVYSVQMKLVIRNLRAQDLGGYKCISKNSIGETEGNIRLYNMGLQEHAVKTDDVFTSEEITEVRDHRGLRLHHVYQGSLKETEITTQIQSDVKKPSMAAAAQIFLSLALELIMFACYYVLLYFI